MNIFLSLFVAFAMLFSGADLPAVPEHATITTIQNLSVQIGSRSAALEPEIRFTTAAGTDELAARFEILRDDEALLPIAGVLTAEKLAFTLADTSHYFSISDAALQSSGMLEEIFSEEEMDMGLSAGLVPMLRALEVAGSDPNFNYQDSYYSAEVLSRLLNKHPFEEKHEINGEERIATTYSFTLRGSQMMASYDELLSCGDPAVEEFYRQMLQSYREMYGKPEANFAELAKDVYDPDTVENLIVTLYEDEGWNYSETTSISEGKEADGHTFASVINYGDRVEIDLQTADGDVSSFGVSGEIVGNLFSPERADLKFTIMEDMSDYDMDSFAAEGSLRLQDGGWQLEMKHGTAPDDLKDGIAVDVSPAADGLRSVSIEIEELRTSISFDILTETIPYAPFFADMEEKPHNLSSASKAQGQMNIDLLSLAADAAALSADESVIDMMNLITGVVQEIALADLPEAVFPLPEGYTLEEEDTESASPYAVFSLGEKWILVHYIHTGENVENYYISPEGEITGVPGRHVSINHYPDVGEGIYAVYVTGAEGDYVFNMEYMEDIEEVKSIVADFCIKLEEQ